MSDDFNRDDDLSWLRGEDDDDQQPVDPSNPFEWASEEGDDDDASLRPGLTGELPWMQGIEEAGDHDASLRPGLTGELPWMQGIEEADDDDASLRPGLTGELPWMQDTERDADSPEGAPGFTASLPWHEGDESAGDDAETDEDLSWLAAAAAEPTAPEQETEPAEPMSPAELPDWLADLDAPSVDEIVTSPPPAPPQPPHHREDQMPDWVKADTSEFTRTPPEVELPDWLAELDDEPEPAEPGIPISETGDIDRAWLDTGQLLPDTHPEDALSFDDWMQQQAAAERPPDIEEEVPDLPVEVGPLDVNEIGTGDLPDWFLGMEEIDTSEAPEWFTGEVPATGDLGTGPLLDALDAGGESRPAAVPEPDDDDLFAGFDFAALTQPDAAPEPADADPDADDLFAGFDFAALTQPDAAPEPADADPDADDLFAGFDFAAATQPDAAPEPADADPDADDLFAGFDFAEAADTDDFFAEFEEAAEEAEPGDMALDEYLAGLSSPLEPEENRVQDWFAEEEEAPPEPADLGWLEELGDLEDLPEVSATSISTGSAQAIPAPDDIDALLRGMDAVELPQSDDLVFDAGGDDLDALFADPAFSDIAMDIPTPGGDAEQLERAEWIDELGATVGAVSAAALVRQQRDRALDELPERLRRLHERGQAQRPTETSAAASPALPGISGALNPAALTPDASTLMGSIAITPDQRRRIDLLRTLAEHAEVTSTPDAPTERIFDDEDAIFLDEQGEAAAAVAPGRRRRAIRIDRLLIALLVAAAVIAPFLPIDGLRLGNPPPTGLAPGSPALAAFETIDALPPGARVLVAAAYSPTAAGELDGPAAAFLWHLLARGARPAVVSTDPLALPRAENLLERIAADPALLDWRAQAPVRDRDYFIVRYLPGGPVGIRTLGTDLPAALGAEAAAMGVQALGDFDAVIIIAERADDLRAWVEQVGPLTDAPLVAAVGFSAAPLVEPYLGAGLGALLVGFPDTYGYFAELGQPPAQPIIPPTPTPTETPTPEVTDEAEEATPEATAEVVEALPTALILAQQAINLREGPGTNFAVVTTVQPATAVSILETSADGSWTRIRLADDIEGWVASNLLLIDASPTPSPAPTDPPTATTAATSTPRPTETRAPSTTPQPTEPPTQAATATTPPTVAPTITPAPTEPPTLTPEPVTITGRVGGTQRANVRTGPGQGFEVITGLEPGTEVPVLGRNGDGTWIRIGLPDGREGWIFADLLQIGAGGGGSSGLMFVRWGAGRALQDAPEATEEAEATEPPPVQPGIPFIANAEARWYSATLGLLAIIGVISLGAVVHIIRALVARRRR